MKEQKLIFEINNNLTPVEDPNGKLMTVLEKIYRDVQCHLELCHKLLKEGKLTEGLKESSLALIDHNITQFLSKLGYDGVLTARAAKYTTQIRSLNDQNRALRHQLGEKVSNEDVRERLKIMDQSFKAWWSEFGFGHCDELSFSGYQAKVVLCGMVFGSRSLKQSDEAKDKYLAQLGFEIDDRRVVYNDKSIELLTKLLTEKYPSVDICDITLTTAARKGTPVIKDVTIFIGDLDEMSDPEPNNNAKEICQ